MNYLWKRICGKEGKHAEREERKQAPGIKAGLGDIIPGGGALLEMVALIADSSCNGPSAASSSLSLIQSQGALGQPDSRSITSIMHIDGPLGRAQSSGNRTVAQLCSQIMRE